MNLNSGGSKCGGTINSLPVLRLATGRNYITVTPKAIAFPASSAHQTCGVVSLQPVTQSLRLPIAFTGQRRRSRTLRRDGAADHDRSAG